MTELNKLNLLALMPCSVKVPLEEELTYQINRISQTHKEVVTYKIASNAVMQENVFASLATAEHLGDMPDIMIAPGFSKFFYPNFVERFVKKSCFSSACADELSPAYQELGIADPEGVYDIIAFNPLIFLVDKTRDPSLPTPEDFDDLLKPCYRKKVAFRGHTSHSVCESILLTYKKLYGEDSLFELGKSIKCRLHPAEMVKYAGSRKEEAPDISLLPLSFAKFVKETDTVKLVWPKQGAIVNPLVMLVKKDVSPAVREVAGLLAGAELGSTLQNAGFYSICKSAEFPLPQDKNYFWIGWDYLRSLDLGETIDRLNGIINSGVCCE